MPDRLTIVVLPGGSLLDVRRLAAGRVAIRCPACGASQVFAANATGVIMPATFVHEDDDCPILRRIEAVLAKLRLRTNRVPAGT